MSGYAPFDAWVEGDEKAISNSAKRGFVLFTGKAAAPTATPAGISPTTNSTTSASRPRISAAASSCPTIRRRKHAFKTPGLRDITQRAPFMHDGSVARSRSRDDPLRLRRRRSPVALALMRPVELAPQEITDLVEFLKTLTGTEAGRVAARPAELKATPCPLFSG